MVGCSGGDADKSQPQGEAGVGGVNAGGSSSTGGSGGAGDGGSGGSGNVAGNTAGSAGQMAGAAGEAGSGGNAGDAGNGGTGNTGNNGGAGGSSPCGEAGHGSTTEGEGTNCAGTSGTSGTAGSSGTSAAAGMAGAAGESGSAGVGGSSGSSGTGSAGSNAGGAGTGGTGNAGAGGDAGTAGVAGSAGSSGTGNAGTAGSAGSGGAVQNTFVCSSWNRNAALDAANTDQFPFVGGIWGTGANSVYVTLHNQNISSGVFHWDGTAWTKTVMPGNPPELNGIWGSSDDDIWVAARNFKGFLYHKSGGIWSDDPNKPVNAKDFRKVWGTSADDVWLLGTDKFVKQSVWRRNGGTTWVQQSLPTLASDTSLYGIWGIDGHVFVTGSDPTGAVLLHFDGSSWEMMTVPGTATQLGFMSGTSINDLFITGTDGAQGIVYHLTNGLTTWTDFTTSDVSLYGPVLSIKPGTFVASGYLAPAGDGKLRVTTCDMNGAVASAVDGYAYNPVSFWAQPGSNTVWSTVAAFGGIAGLYAANCN